MLPQSYKLSHELCLNDFLQVWLIGNKRYQVTPFRYINWDDEVSHLVRGRKLLGDMQNSLRSVKLAAQTVGIWTEDNWDMNTLNSLYTMASRKFIFKRINKMFDLLS